MMNYLHLGDSALIIKTGNDISETSNLIVRKLLLRLGKENIRGVLDFIPSYNELMICFDPAVIMSDELVSYAESLSGNIDEVVLPEPSVVRIPVLYGGNSGPDIHEVAEINKLSEEEVISIHCSPLYLVYMLGFTPGFCYLGGMDDRIATPRKTTPRLRIEAGSVGIADRQTGIYPIDSPGGWQLIGKTPVKLFDADRSPEFLLNPGDYIKFYQVDGVEYTAILEKVNSGNYLPGKSLF
jgi:inhibitor of KinA